jgi:hypothetical protein
MLNSITIACSSGLSNRIRTLLGFYYMCQQTNKQLTVMWPVDDVCNGYFLDYYEPLPNVTFIMEYSNKNLYFIGEDKTESLLKNHGFIADKQLIFSLYSNIKLKKNIWNTIKLFVNNNNIEDCIGLHIRRTDFTGNFINNLLNGSNPDNAFFDYIEKHSNGKRFFLACDNHETQKIYKLKYGPRAIFFQRIRNVNAIRQTCLETAIIDMYILSFCKKIKGTNNSSFSKTALLLKKSRKYINQN